VVKIGIVILANKRNQKKYFSLTIPDIFCLVCRQGLAVQRFYTGITAPVAVDISGESLLSQKCKKITSLRQISCRKVVKKIQA
jgi:hypothetical protein